MSTLLIRCPFKPFAGTLTGVAGEWSDLACAQRFEWCLVRDEDRQNAALSSLVIPKSPMQSGIGSIDSMPYADEALVLMPTLDVRLIEAKVPLTSPKKLQAILPTLLEEYLLSGTASLHITALPPLAGKPAIERTLVAIDRVWLMWLTSQLEQLLTHRVRLIPDCLILSLPSSAPGNDGVPASVPALMTVCESDAIVYCQRTGIQMGIAWTEYRKSNAGQHNPLGADHSSNGASPLPSCLGLMTGVAFSWAWAAPSAIAYIEENASSRQPNFALNLLPAEFNKNAGSRRILSGHSLNANTGFNSAHHAARLAWLDPITWQPALRWLSLGIAAIALGLVVQLAWLSISNWRWGQQMELLGMQSLTPASMGQLSSGSDPLNGNDPQILPILLEQTIVSQRSQAQ